MFNAFASLKCSKEKHNVQKPILGRSEIGGNLITRQGKGNNIFKITKLTSRIVSYSFLFFYCIP